LTRPATRARRALSAGAGNWNRKKSPGRFARASLVRRRALRQAAKFIQPS